MPKQRSADGQPSLGVDAMRRYILPGAATSQDLGFFLVGSRRQTAATTARGRMDASNRTALIQRLQECSDDGGNVYLIGVGLGLFASICINIGQNLQAKGLHALNEQQEQQQQQRQHELELEQAARAGGAPQQQPHQQQEPQPQKPKPCESRTWAIGLSIFIFGSLVNFLAFAFAPATVLVALEAVQYVSNVAFNRFVNGATIACRIYMGVALAVLGTGVVVAFGPQDSAVWTVDDLLHRWTYAIWWARLVLLMATNEH